MYLNSYFFIFLMDDYDNIEKKFIKDFSADNLRKNTGSVLDFDAFIFGMDDDIKQILEDNGAFSYQSLDPEVYRERERKAMIERRKKEDEEARKRYKETGILSGRLLAEKIDPGRIMSIEEEVEDTLSFCKTPIKREELISNIKNLAKRWNFELPKKDYFPFFYKIGFVDTDAAYLYDPKITGYLFFDFTNHNDVVTVSEALSSKTRFPVLSIYQSERFSFPKLELYENGISVSRSAPAGKEEYTQEYWKNDMDKLEKDMSVFFEADKEYIKKIAESFGKDEENKHNK